VIRRTCIVSLAAAGLLLSGPAAAQTLSESVGLDLGTTGTFALPAAPEPPAAKLKLPASVTENSLAARLRHVAVQQQEGQVEATRGERPPRDPVGGFQFAILGGVQLRGSASGAGGIALGYYDRASASFGIELEGAFTRGPTGDIVHVMLSAVLQSGARSSRMVPYLTFGAGAYRAQERLRDAVRDVLPDFGIEISEETEIGPIVGVGLGVRYFLSPKVSFRADYREFRALTTGSGDFFDRLYALRRIAGYLAFDL